MSEETLSYNPRSLIGRVRWHFNHPATTEEQVALLYRSGIQPPEIAALIGKTKRSVYYIFMRARRLGLMPTKNPPKSWSNRKRVRYLLRQGLSVSVVAEKLGLTYQGAHYYTQERSQPKQNRGSHDRLAGHGKVGDGADERGLFESNPSGSRD